MSAGDSTAMQRPAGEVTQDLVEQFDSRWLGAGEYEHSMAQPESLDGYARGPDFFSRGVITAQRMSFTAGFPGALTEAHTCCT